MAWQKDYGKSAKVAADRAESEATRAELASDFIVEKQPLISTFTDEQTNLQTQLNDLTSGLTVDSEVIQARGGEPTLNARLNKTAAQLADTMAVTENIKIKGIDVSGYGKKSKTLVTFVSDDGQDTDYTILKPIFEVEGIPCCMAITTGHTGKLYFDKPIRDEHGLELQSMGWEILGHTHNHPYMDSDGLTEEDTEFQFTENNRILRERGYIVNNLMYPHGESNHMIRRIARKYYRAACTYGHGAIDVPPFDTYKINRVGLGSWFDGTVDNASKYPVGTRNTFETYYKPRVDEAIEKGGWLIFGLHSNAPMFDETQQNYLRQTIQYVKTKGLPVVTINEGLDLIGNTLDVEGYNESDEESKYFRIGSDGSISTSEIKSLDAIDVVMPNNAVDLNSPLSTFEYGKISYCFTNSGMLITHYKYDDWAWQTLRKKDGNIQTRSIVYPAMTWTDWKIIATSESTRVVTDSTNTCNSVLSNFQTDKITYTYCKSAVGSPSSTLGLLITERVASDDTVFQTFKPTNKPELYTRYWVYSSSSWSAWKQVAYAGLKKNWYRTNVTVTANNSLDVIVTGLKVAVDDIVVGSPYLGLPNGVSYYIYVGSESIDNVHIKFINHLATNVNVNVEWMLKVV